ncbi:CbtA family protein [uncultured Pelagibacterium sp.]|uniref:CbtA family protein n=1 Tax=uncultured Pelagibacterium sp. TaxID=1159875 RepID=UPI0030D9E38C|tara:strand:+ start:4477 stop:5166 length:690 start_codon:yes stop_codon:yes gene_type:complete
MFRNLFFAALIAALCAGLATSIIQHFRLIPLIVAAESYEGEAPHDHGEQTVAPHSHDEGEWMPADGFERTAFTVAANLLMAAGFAFVITAISLIFNLPVTPQTGLAWGVGGFIAFSLAPALGLPPGLPGMPVAETGARQIWWVFAAVSTALGLLAIAKWRTWWALALAAILIVLPHVVGAPRPPLEETGVPAGLAASFASAVLANGLVFWVVLGVSYGVLTSRFSRRVS